MPEVPCLVDDPELWFGQLPEEVEQAESLCARCPGREACLEGALSRREPWGVWGGQLLVDGHRRGAQASPGAAAEGVGGRPDGEAARRHHRRRTTSAAITSAVTTTPPASGRRMPGGGSALPSRADSSRRRS